MLRFLIGALAIFFVVVIGLSLYLRVDDLLHCGAKPGQDTNCQVVDAIVAVSGGDTQARTMQAVELYKSGWSSMLIFSGAAQDKSGPSNAAAMKTLALSAGVPAEDIYLDEYSDTTQQNAENTQTIFKNYGIKKVILVTSGYHQRRASLEFNKRASDVVILNHPTQNDSDWSIWWWLTLKGWWLALSEITKIIVFYITSIWL